MIYNIEWNEGSAAKLTIMEDDHSVVREVFPVMTLLEACRLLRRSRRHLYRYIERQWIIPLVKFSGEYFFDPADILALIKKNIKREPGIPKQMALLFPEYERRSLHLKRDSSIILSRILERGTTKEVLWLKKHYSSNDRREFLGNQGERTLSPRAYHYWNWLWKGPKSREQPLWRPKGQEWGGLR